MDQKSNSIKVSAAHVLGTFYFIAGIMLLVLMAQSRYMPFYLGLIGVLNMIASYGIVRARRPWLHMVIYVSLINIIFGSTTITAIAGSLGQDFIGTLMLSGIVAFVILSILSLMYVAHLRKKST